MRRVGIRDFKNQATTLHSGGETRHRAARDAVGFFVPILASDRPAGPGGSGATRRRGRGHPVADGSDRGRVGHRDHGVRSPSTLMRLAVDTSVLVGELRVSGRARLADERLELFISAHGWSEVQHELPCRVGAVVRRHRLTAGEKAMLVSACLDAVVANARIVDEAVYAPWEDEARSRSVRDPSDWPQVACAPVLSAGIWTIDSDSLGTGIATWTTESLRHWLDRNLPR